MRKKTDNRVYGVYEKCSPKAENRAVVFAHDKLVLIHIFLQCSDNYTNNSFLGNLKQN